MAPQDQSQTKFTSGERLVRCLTGERTDRAPFGVGIGWYPWASTLERWRRESGIPDLEIWRQFGFDSGFTVVPAEYGIFPHFTEEIIAEDATSITRRTWHGIVKRDLKADVSMAEWLDYPVHSPAEWEWLREERLVVGDPGRVTLDWASWRERRTQGEALQIGAYPFGVFGTVRDLLGVETMLLWFYDHPDVIRDMMTHLTTLWLSVYEAVATHVRIDLIHIWEDMSGKQGSLISPAMIDQFMMPCYDRIAAFAKTHRVPLISVDSDGQCDELVEIMTRHGVNVFYPFEVQAGNDILAYRTRYPELGILGGLDKNALAADRAAIDREVDKARRMLRHGRYIPGFDHLIPDNVPWENMCYAVERLKEVCFTAS